MLTRISSWYNNDISMATWQEWQKYQPPIHYERCSSFRNYLTAHPQFLPPPSNNVTTPEYLYYVYCFGDYACLIVNNIDSEYIALLLHIYDYCKGPVRRLSGDPPLIQLMRSCGDNIQPLRTFDYYLYSYYTIHAHTVAHHSLSTLFGRLLAHCLSEVAGARIEASTCKKAYEDCTLSMPKPVAILPRVAPYIYLRCRICERITEHHWGDKLCLDCYINYNYNT